jgi:hypothetical protein
LPIGSIKNQYTIGELMLTNLTVSSSVSEKRVTGRLTSTSGFGAQFQPSVETCWEKLLENNGISETACSTLIACRSEEGHAIRAWVREHYKTNFVPEDVLESLGLRDEVNLKWKAEECDGSFPLSSRQ